MSGEIICRNDAHCTFAVSEHGHDGAAPTNLAPTAFAMFAIENDGKPPQVILKAAVAWRPACGPRRLESMGSPKK